MCRRLQPPQGRRQRSPPGCGQAKGEQFVQNAERIPAAVLDDTHLSLIAGGSTRDEDSLALRRVGNASAVAGKTLDAEG